MFPTPCLLSFPTVLALEYPCREFAFTLGDGNNVCIESDIVKLRNHSNGLNTMLFSLKD